MEREYEDLAAVIEAAGGSAFVVGSSGGAVLALRAAAAGVPISRLALWEPSYIVVGTRPVPGRQYTQRLETLGRGGPVTRWSCSSPTRSACRPRWSAGCG